MPRFSGTPVEKDTKKPRFSGVAADSLPIDPRQRAMEVLAKSPEDREQPSPEAMASPLENLPMSATKAAGFGAADVGGMGFADELGALVGSQISGDPYSQVLDEMRALDTGARKQHPYAYPAGQVGGALAQAIATRGAGFMPNADTLVGRMIGSGLTGGAYGATYGAGRGTDTKSRLVEALLNGGVGATVGAAVPLVAEGASRGYSALHNWLSPAVPKGVGASPDAVRMLADVMQADDTLGATGQANIAAAGDRGMLADAGPNAQKVLDTAIQKAGPGATLARQRIAERTAGSAEDITNALDMALGQPEGVEATRRAIRLGTAADRSQAYGAAYSKPIDYAAPEGQSLENIIKTRVPKSAIDAANELMRTEGASSKQILAKIADDGTVTMEKLPDVQQIDYITRGLNEVADAANSQGKLGGTTARGRAYGNLSKEIRDLLRGLVPEYGTALDTAADPIQRSKAVEFGANLLSSGVSRDAVEQTVAGMGQAEKTALAQGVRSSIDDALANVKRTVMDGDTTAREAIKAIKDMSSRANREKLTAAIGEDAANTLFAKLDEAAQSFNLRAGVAENSKTYARGAVDRRMAAMAEPSWYQTFLPHPIKSTQRLAESLLGQSPADIERSQAKFAAELSDLLTRPAAKSPELYDIVGNVARRDAADKLLKERLAKALIGARLSYPAVALTAGRRQ